MGGQDVKPEHMIPDAHDPSKKHPPMMTTADLSLRMDPAYEKIAAASTRTRRVCRRLRPRLVQADPPRHGPPRPLYKAPGTGRRPHLARPLPAVDHALIDASDAAALKRQVLASGLTVAELVSHRLGLGIHLPRQRQARRCATVHASAWPAKDWEANQPAQLAKVLGVLEGIQAAFNATNRRQEGPVSWPT